MTVTATESGAPESGAPARTAPAAMQSHHPSRSMAKRRGRERARGFMFTSSRWRGPRGSYVRRRRSVAVSMPPYRYCRGRFQAARAGSPCRIPRPLRRASPTIRHGVLAEPPSSVRLRSLEPDRLVLEARFRTDSQRSDYVLTNAGIARGNPDRRRDPPRAQP